MPDLTPANQNQWYVLMTLYGEHQSSSVAWGAHLRSVSVWNAWVCQALDQATRDQMVIEGIELPEEGAFLAIEDEVRSKHRSVMLSRNGADFDYPGFPIAEDIYDLSGLEFSNAVLTERMIFLQRTTFASSSFLQSVFMNKTKFFGNADFNSVSFWKDAEFAEAYFRKEVFFGKAKFGEVADFDETVFMGKVNFYSASLAGRAAFGHAAFIDEVSFRSATFARGANFTSVTFSQSVSFFSAVFM